MQIIFREIWIGFLKVHYLNFEDFGNYKAIQSTLLVVSKVQRGVVSPSKFLIYIIKRLTPDQIITLRI